jgi:hypothetical protein
VVHYDKDYNRIVSFTGQHVRSLRSTRIPQLSPTPRRQLAPGTSRHVGRSDRRDPLV